MYINYEYYRVFYYIAKYGTVSQAAKLLRNNQPNLTRTIKVLESELGCPLFSRTNRGMKLTPEGERLYQHIRIAVEHIAAGEAEVAESKSLQTGTVSVAASEVALRCLLLPILKRYRSDYPGVHIRISNHSTPQAIDALKNGFADIAVVTSPTVPAASLTELPVKPIREVAVCAPMMESRIHPPATPADLLRCPIVSLGEDTKSFAFFSEWFALHGLPFRADIEACTADQILPMVEAGLGVGFVPADFLAENRAVRVIPLAEPIPERQVVLVKRKDQPLGLAAKKLEQMIRSAANA